MRSFFLLLFCAYGAQADFWGCKNVRNLTLTDMPFAYPFDTLIPQPYGNLSGGCAVWQFSIPAQKYATIVLSAEFDPAPSTYFEITNSIGFGKEYSREWVSSIPPNIYGATYFFPVDPFNHIFLSSNSSGFLSFRIDLHDVPSTPAATELKVDSELNAVLPLYQIATKEYRFKHQKNGSDLILSMAVKNPIDVSVDSCFVYEGPSCKDGTFYGGFGYLSDGFSSHSDDVAVCCFSAKIPEFYLIAVSRPAFLKDDDVWISRIIAEQTVDLDYFSSRPFEPSLSNKTSQYLTTYCPDPKISNCVEYVQGVYSIDSNNTAPLKNLTTFAIYAGYPGWKNFIRLNDIKPRDTEMWLPQEVRGTFKTYEALRGDLRISLTLDSKAWNYTTSGRKGFFMTNHYADPSQDQTTVSTIYTLPNAQFTSDSYAYMANNPNGTLWLNTDTDIVYLPTNSNVVLHGSFLQFNVVQKSTPSSGDLVFFEIKQGAPIDSSTTVSTVTVFLLAVANYLLH